MNARFVEGPVFDFVKMCVDIPRFLGCCRECPNYDKRWSCPPYGFSVEGFWKQYTSILLYEVKVPISRELLGKSYEQEELNAINGVLIAPVKEQMMHDLLEMERQNSGSRALYAGTCELCESCYKVSGESCKHPELMRYSIESLGGNVAQAVKFYFDDEILWAKDGKLPEYYVLLGGLLKL